MQSSSEIKQSVGVQESPWRWPAPSLHPFFKLVLTLVRNSKDNSLALFTLCKLTLTFNATPCSVVVFFYHFCITEMKDD